MNSRRNFVVCLLAVLIVPPALAQTKGNPTAETKSLTKYPQTKLDRYRDPIPEGAISRLGGMRFRHHTMTTCVTFSPDEKILATGSLWEIRMWNPQTGKMIREIRQGAYAMAFSHDGNRLVVTGRPHPQRYSSRIILFDTKTWKPIWDVGVGFDHRGDPNQCYIQGLEFSQNDRKVIALGRMGKVRILDAKNGSEVWTKFFTAKKNSRQQSGRLATSKFNSRMVLGFGSNLYVYDSASPSSKKPLKITEGLRGNITALALASPDLLISASQHVEYEKNKYGFNENFRKDVWLDLWNLKTGKREGSLKVPKNRETISSMVVSQNRKKLYVLHRRWIDIWDMVTKKRTGGFPLGSNGAYYGNVHKGIAFAVHSKLLAIVKTPRTITLFDLETRKPKFSLQKGHVDKVVDLVWTPDGKKVISVGQDGTIRFWNPETGEQVNQYKYWNGDYYIYDLAISDDGNYLAVGGYTNKPLPGSDTGLLKIWDIHSGKVIQEIRGKGVGVSAVFSHDGRLIASELSFVPKNNSGRAIHIFETKTGKIIQAVDIPSTSCHALSFSSDNNFLRVANSSAGFLEMDVRTGKVRKLPIDIDKNNRCEGAAFDASGDIVVLRYHFEARLHDLTGNQVRIYNELNHPGFVISKKYSESLTKFAQLLAVKRDASNFFRNAIDVLDTLSGKTVFSTGPVDLVTDVCLSPDGSKLATAMHDGTILIWNIFDNSKWNDTETVLKMYWKYLGSSSITKVWQAINRMTSTPEKTVVFLSKRLIPTEKDLPSDTKKLIAELASKSFAKRRQAYSKLKSYGSAISYILQQSAKTTRSPEVKKRLLQLIQSSETQNLRSIQILERIGAEKAKSLIEKLANGDPKTNQTTEAKRILKRWKMQK